MPTCPFCRLHTESDELVAHIASKHPEQDSSLAFHRRTQQRHIVQPKKTTPIILNGNEVVEYKGQIKVLHLKKAHISLKKLGFTPIIFVSFDLREKVDKKIDLIRLINLGMVKEVEKKEEILVEMLEEAIELNCQLICNQKISQISKNVNSNGWSLEDNIRNYDFSDLDLKLI